MVQFVNAVMIERRSRLLDALLVGVLFVCLLASLFGFVHHRIDQEAVKEAEALLGHQKRVERLVQGVLDDLKKTIAAVPCSQTFREQLHRFAYLPDGISEFFYAEDGWILCSLNVPRFAAPVDLGEPDMKYKNGAAVWIDRDLKAFDLAGMTGSIVMRDNLGFIVPPQPRVAQVPAWLDLEGVIRLPSGRFSHRDGAVGIYAQNLLEPNASMRGTVCDERERQCAAFRIHPIRFIVQHQAEIVLFALFLAGVAVALAVFIKAQVRRYCSFESRFRRHLGPASIVCSYQPVMELHTGRIVGCEVLARWRDVDGSIAMPDRFIPLVERDGMTLEFTRSIVERAMRELSGALPTTTTLSVAFNVFPKDLADPRLPQVFEACRADRDRFAIIAEIVESAAFSAEEARSQIEALRQNGIGVYLDDFGAGYSNIQNLGALPVEGVELDRAFAMAPDDSLMARMLANAINLIKVAGRTIVVEGVETAARVEHLRGMGAAVDRIQGYHISRPLPIDAFAKFLAANREPEGQLPVAA